MHLWQGGGVLGSSGISPVSGYTLSLVLERIDKSKLSGALRDEYEYLESILTEPEVIVESSFFAFKPDVRVNAYGNIADYSAFDWSNYYKDEPSKYHANDTLLPYRFVDPFAKVKLNFYFSPYLALEGEIFAGNNNHHLYESSLGFLMNFYGGSFSSIGKEGSISNMPIDIPYYVVLSAGAPFISFILGRVPTSLSNGVISNLIVGDNFVYQETAKLSFTSNWFTYDMVVTRFDEAKERDDGYYSMSRNEFDGKQQIRVVHQFDVNIVNKVRLAAIFSTIYSSSSIFDLRFFYPFFIQHNYYNYDNNMDIKEYDEANNMMGFSLDAALYKGLTLNFQFVLDQMKTAFETNDEVPMAWGIMGNLKYSMSLRHGFLDSYFEVAYTNPYLYLNGKRYKDENHNYKYNYNLDYIVGYHFEYLDDVGYSGYVYGPDSFVISLGSVFSSYDDRWEAGGNFTYRAQGSGVFGIKSESMHNTLLDFSSSTLQSVMESSVADTLEHMLLFKLGAKYNFDIGISLYAGVSAAVYLNYSNISGDTAFNPLLMMGLSYAY